MGGSRGGGGCVCVCVGGGGVRTPLKIRKNVGFLSNTSLDPLKNHKAASIHRHTSQTLFKCSFGGRPMMGGI